MLMNVDSTDFIASLRSGSEEAFTILHNHYNLSLCSYAYRILGDNNEAKEVVHITFCKIWDNRKRIEITESLKSYLYKSVYIIASVCLGKISNTINISNWVWRLYFTRIVQNPFVELKLLDSESRKIILSAINELPDRRRDIFIRCNLRG